MNPISWNHLGARIAPFLMAACIGLELSRITWLAMPDPANGTNASQVQPEKSAANQPKTIASAAVLEAMKLFNPWETIQVEKEKPPPVKETREVVVDSNLELMLIGSMVLPHDSRAVMTRKKDPNNQMVLQVGDEVDGAYLKKIERHAVYFENRGRTERIVMPDGLKPEPSAAATPAAGTAQPSAPSSSSTLPRAEYEAMIGKGMNLLAGVNVTPFYQGSDALGYRVKFADAKPEFTRIGLANEDVIQKVNGISVTDAQKISELAGKLKGLGTIRIDLLRDNQPKTIELSIGN
ncbi:MAG: hypothetical protein HQL95_01445 [Magnetococcales bacterium]|nr:hypothetical protein [Magnetococcales bacterium]